MDNQPANDINDVMPASLSELIGQRSVVEQVRVALASAAADNRPFDSALLVGPGGTGKTQTARTIAAMMQSDLHAVLGQTLQTPADLNGLFLGAAADKDVVLIDEAALIPSEQQHALLIALDERRIVLGGGRAGQAPHSIPLANFTLLLATTDEFQVISPLAQRMRLVLRFQFYDEADLAEITRQRCRALGWPIDDEVLPLIAKRSRGVPRLALRLTQAARRVTRSEDQNRITLAHLHRACELEQLDEIGLGPTDQQYLHLLADGESRLNVLASRLGLPTRTVQLTESYLLRSNLIAKDDGGRRALTAKGRQHLARKTAATR